MDVKQGTDIKNALNIECVFLVRLVELNLNRLLSFVRVFVCFAVTISTAAIQVQAVVC